MNTIDLNCASPDQIGNRLRAAAQAYRESRAELQSAWQDDKAGYVWDRLALDLEACAIRCDNTVKKHFR